MHISFTYIKLSNFQLATAQPESCLRVQSLPNVVVVDFCVGGAGSRTPLSANCSPQIFARVLSQPSKTPLNLHLFTHLSDIILNLKIIFWNIFSLSANSQIIDLLRNRRVRERVERPSPCRVRRWGCRHATANQLTAQTSCYETSGPAQLCKWPNHSWLAVRKRCFSRLMTNLIPTQTLYSSNCTVLLGTSRLGPLRDCPVPVTRLFSSRVHARYSWYLTRSAVRRRSHQYCLAWVLPWNTGVRSTVIDS